MFVSPITGYSNITLVKTIPSESLIQSWKNILEIDITNELHQCQEIYLFKCNETQLKFFAPFEIAGSEKLYEQLQRFDWYYMSKKWEHQVALKNLHDCKQILEVGSAFGSFVELAIKSGLNIKGIELNKAAVRIAQQKNLPVEHLDLQELAKQAPQSLDAICSFQVLEHISQPKDFIEWSIQLLKPNGKLIFCVPNSESFLQYQDNLLDMPPHHMLRWSTQSFKALEKIFPVRLEKRIIEPLASYHVSLYLDSYSSYFRSISPLYKLLFNRHTTPVYRKLLKTGLRRFLTGQSLYVQFRKVDKIA
ncbi:class I SAM-dependent methyltransferase [Scytonema sp. NUACC26]|uniref:class I SAM-dependent methyltransferase n=1 Tax=Scytonema sp. NUACC26 TaxID=3140176 RepID=UPI0034DBC11A